TVPSESRRQRLEAQVSPDHGAAGGWHLLLLLAHHRAVPLSRPTEPSHGPACSQTVAASTLPPRGGSEARSLSRSRPRRGTCIASAQPTVRAPVSRAPVSRKLPRPCFAGCALGRSDLAPLAPLAPLLPVRLALGPAKAGGQGTVQGAQRLLRGT